MYANYSLQEEPEDYAFPLTLKQKSKPNSPLPGAAVEGAALQQVDGQVDELTNGQAVVATSVATQVL